jgi:hypothetical protein
VKPTIDQVRARAKKADAHKEQWRSLYEECYEYFLPQRNLYDGNWEGNVPGREKMKRVFDSTGVNATVSFANKVQSALFPPQREWCRLVPGEEIPPAQRMQAQTALDAYTKKMFGVLRQSKFDLAMGEYLLDLAIGTAVMHIAPGDELTPIRFTAVPSFLISFDEGAHGKPQNVYRKLKRPFEVIAQEWTDAEIPPQLAAEHKDKPTEMVELTEACIYDPDGPDQGFYHYWVLTKTEQIVYRKMTSSPWVIGRYVVASNERYGRGPCQWALPDCKTLNKVIELTLKASSLSIGGVFTAADDGVLNPQTVRIVPGAIIPVARNGGPNGPSLAPLPRAGDPQLSQIQSNDLRMSIKKAMLDEGLPPQNMSARSATEINHAIGQLAQQLGSAYGRLISETLFPVVRRTLELMDEMGLIVLPLKVDGLAVRIMPLSPLAMAQNTEKVGELMQFLQIAQSLGPAGVMGVKMDKITDYVGDLMGIPADLRTTPEERAMMAQEMAAAAAGQMEQQQAGAIEQQPAQPV